MHKLSIEEDDSETIAHYLKILFENWNNKRIEQLCSMLSKKSHFITVGCLQLPRKGIIVLLRKEGFEVTPLT